MQRIVVVLAALGQLTIQVFVLLMRFNFVRRRIKGTSVRVRIMSENLNSKRHHAKSMYICAWSSHALGVNNRNLDSERADASTRTTLTLFDAGRTRHSGNHET